MRRAGAPEKTERVLCPASGAREHVAPRGWEQTFTAFIVLALATESGRLRGEGLGA